MDFLLRLEKSKKDQLDGLVEPSDCYLSATFQIACPESLSTLVTISALHECWLWSSTVQVLNVYLLVLPAWLSYTNTQVVASVWARGLQMDGLRWFPAENDAARHPFPCSKSQLCFAPVALHQTALRLWRRKSFPTRVLSLDFIVSQGWRNVAFTSMSRPARL